METKSFLIEEQKEVIFESEKNQEWLTLVEELGLTGQKKLININEGVLSPMPFPALTNAEREIYQNIFTSQEDYKKYSDETIPLICLSLIALAEKEKYFHKIEIWYSQQYTDPLVIGTLFDDPLEAKKSWSYSPRKYYKIAQWGAKIKSLLELIPIYKEIEEKRIKESCETNLKNLEKTIIGFEFEAKAFQI